MNRFKIILGKENEFEQVWRTRETYLEEVDGFKEFHLLKGETNEGYTLYSSHSVWDSKDDFISWTKSESFRKRIKVQVKINLYTLGIQFLKVLK